MRTDASSCDAPDVLIVARQDDGVAVRLSNALAARGKRALILDGPGAARFFTLHGGPEGSTVQPQLPVFSRASAWWYGEADASGDEQFLRGECYAALWAAMSLSAAPVINRPGRTTGVLYRMTPSALAALPSQCSTPVSEVFASGPDRVDDPEGRFWGESIAFHVRPLADMPPDVPLRARAVETDAGYEIVTVVGDRAIPATTDARTLEQGLGPRSVVLAKAASLHFATITWAVTEDRAVPVRLNAGPDEAELRYAWTDVAAALCEDLTP